MRSIKPIRILVIDDDEDDFEIFSELINKLPDQNFKTEWCPNFESGRKALLKYTHDIYFVDYHLGLKTGIELIREAVKVKCEEPIILLTGQGTKKIDSEALRSGATDYLVKSQLTSEQLDRCIRYSLERSNVLKKLRASELKYRLIFERSKDIIFLSNDQLQVKSINNAGSELLGFEKEELLHPGTAQLFEHFSEKNNLIEKLNTDKKIIDQQVEFIAKNKARKICLLSASIEKDEKGENYVQGIIHDVSLFKRMEDIKMQSEKLESKRITIRTLAHEIRNPLNNIILSVEYLKNYSATESLEFLNIISRNSKRINDLINELLDSNQYYKLKLEITDLQAILKEATEDNQYRFEIKNIKLVWHHASSESLALIDKDKMKIVFSNIMVNAVDAMKQNGILTISISTEGNFHVIEINDNGCGISPENITKLFEPYFTTKSMGLGLGLASAYSILQSHKALIDVRSVPDQSSTFKIKVLSVQNL